MDIKEQYVSLETAKLAKEKGFNQYYHQRYNKETGELEYSPCIKHTLKVVDGKMTRVNITDMTQIFAPTQSLLQRYLREVHNIHILIEFNTLNESYAFFIDYKYNKTYTYCEGDFQNTNFKSYEEALEKGLYQALQLIK